MILRKFPTRENGLNFFLTFDDGPDPKATPLVLDLLNEFGMTASFFVIGKKAERNKTLIQQVQSQGSRVLTHSLDHDYRRYFHHVGKMKAWIRDSVDHLAQITGERAPAFRPPAGIITPPLYWAAQELQIPLVLWNHRFFDSRWAWTQKKANRSLRRLQSGDIILLHDVQLATNKELFLKTLRFYLLESQARNFKSTAISNKDLGS